MIVNDAQKLIDACSDSNLLISFNHASLSDLRTISSLHISEGLIYLVDDLLTNLFKITIKLLDCKVYFSFLGPQKRILLLLELTFPLEKLLFALPARFLIDLVLAISLSEVEVAIVQDGRIVSILMLHSLL